MTSAARPFRHIVITGASSGIGAALARHYSRLVPAPRLSLSGRDLSRLADIEALCRSSGAAVFTQSLDVANRQAMQDWIEACDEALPVDLVIANAGVSGGTGDPLCSVSESPAQRDRLFAVNVAGVWNTIDPLIPRMAARRGGHIAIVSSLAGFRGWPGAPAYCASKAAIRAYGEGLGGLLAPQGVKVHVICPGFVASNMTDANQFSMPMMISADKAAGIIARGIAKNRGRIAFPARAYFIVQIINLLPDALAQALLTRLPRKRRMDL